MYNRNVKLSCALAVSAVLILPGCGRRIDNKEAVRQGVIDYLSTRSNLNVGAMQVDVASVTFRKDEADAMVAFRPKGAGGAGQGMQIRYTLERKGDRWVVKGKSEGAGQHGSAGLMPGGNPHGAMGMEMPPESAPGAAMPPGHPSIGKQPPAGAKQ